MYIIRPWEKYRYKCLPMGVSNAPDIFQDKMNEVFRGFEFIWAYINDLLIIITKCDWSSHFNFSELTPHNLKDKDNELNWNIKKSSFGQPHMEYLGFWGTRIGTRPINKKVESIVNMTPQNNTREVRVFVGLINYYKDIWSRRSHILQPLTSLTPPTMKFKWSDVGHK